MNRKKTLLFLLAFLAMTNCAVYQSVQAPIMRVLRRGSCIAVDIPPITLTPERTAAERQLMGKETEIEPEGWLIASAQSSAYALPSAEALTEKQKVRRYYIERGTLDFYEDAVRYYKSIGLLGESYDGRLLPVPLKYLNQETKEAYLSERETALLVAKEVNQARKWLRDYQKKHKGNQKETNPLPYQRAKRGEWRRDASGRWSKIK